MNLQVVVAVRTGEPNPERARGLCWRALLWELHGQVEGLVIETRSGKQDRHDAQTIIGQRPRCCGPIGYRFARPQGDELLWVADAVAGAVFQSRGRDNPEYLEALAGIRLRVVDL